MTTGTRSTYTILNSDTKDIIYFMIGDQPAPQGGGDTRSWFFYYKLQEGESFVPFPNLRDMPLPLHEWAGARLWFILDREIVTCATVLRVEEDPLNNTYELWYRGSDLVDLRYPFEPETPARIFSGDLWKELVQTRPPGTSAGS